MVLNIIIILVFILFATLGMKKGFIASILDMFKVILALFLATTLTPLFKKIIMDNTSLLSGNSEPDSFLTFIPKILENKFLSPISDLILSSIIFLLLYIFFKWIVKLLSSLISWGTKKDSIGSLDKFLGLGLGSLKGIIIISLSISCILPFFDFIGFAPKFNGQPVNFQEIIEKSYLGNYFYNENPLWKMIIFFSKGM